jgi:hypothetical protein
MAIPFSTNAEIEVLAVLQYCHITTRLLQPRFGPCCGLSLQWRGQRGCHVAVAVVEEEAKQTMLAVGQQQGQLARVRVLCAPELGIGGL